MVILDSNSLFDHHQPIQSVALAGVQLNFDRLVGMFRVAFGKKYTKPVESMEARVSEILVDPYVLEENVSHEDVPRESSSPVGLESPDSSSEDIFSTPKFPHQTGLRSSLPIPPTIPTETEDLGNDNDEDEMMKIITRPTALGGSLLTAPVIPFGQVQPVIEEDDGDRPYDPGEEDGRTNSNFSYLDLNSVKSLNSDNLNRIRSYSELIRDRGDTATEVSFMSSNGVSDTPSSPVHEGTEDTAGPCGANPVILPLEDRRFDGTQDVDLRSVGECIFS